MHVYKVVPSCKAIHAKKEALAEEDYDGYNVNEEKNNPYFGYPTFTTTIAIIIAISRKKCSKI